MRLGATWLTKTLLTNNAKVVTLTAHSPRPSDLANQNDSCIRCVGAVRLIQSVDESNVVCERRCMARQNLMILTCGTAWNCATLASRCLLIPINSRKIELVTDICGGSFAI